MKVYIIQEEYEGIPEEPKVFSVEAKAQAEAKYEKCAVKVGFRKRRKKESFLSYRYSFWDWENSSKCKYDKMDYCLRYWGPCNVREPKQS